MNVLNAIPKVRPTAEGSEAFRQQMGVVSRQSSIFFAGTVFTAGAGYLFKVYLARVLGAEALGVYALGMTIVGFLGIFNALGLPQSALRFVAKYCAKDRADMLRGFLARSGLYLLLANVALGAGILWMGPWTATHFYHTPGLIPYLPLFALIMLLGALNTFLGQVMAGYKDVGQRTIITNFVGSPLMMLFSLGLISAGMGLRGYIEAQIAAAAIVLALLFSAAWRLTPKAARSLSPRGLPPLEREVVGYSAAVFGVNLLEFLMAQTDKVLIGFYLDAREVGIYAVAAALVVFVPVVLQSVNQIFAPTIADLHTRGEIVLLGRMFQTLTKWILGLTLPLATVLTMYARPLMRLFGVDFETGWSILLIGTLGQLVNCAVGSVGYLLLMSGHQHRLIRIQIVMAAAVVGLSVVLIPRWGITGAALAAAATNAATNIWYLRDVKRFLGLFPYNRSYWRLVVPSLLMVSITLLFRMESSIRPPWLDIGLALLLTYGVFVAMVLALGLDSDDRVIATAVWAKLRGAFQRAEVRA